MAKCKYRKVLPYKDILRPDCWGDDDLESAVEYIDIDMQLIDVTSWDYCPYCGKKLKIKGTYSPQQDTMEYTYNDCT